MLLACIFASSVTAGERKARGRELPVLPPSPALLLHTAAAPLITAKPCLPPQAKRAEKLCIRLVTLLAFLHWQGA